VGQHPCTRFLRNAVVLSDDAGRFDIGQPALCWIHAERLVHKLDTFPDLQSAAQQRIRTLIWDFYAELKIYRANPSKNRRVVLRARFDRIFHRRTGFVTLDHLLARLHANKAELLMVLQRPEIPPAYQRFGERHPRPGHPPQGQRKHAATADAIVAMPSLGSPRPAPSTASHSGIIWEADCASPANRSSRRYQTSSDAAGSPHNLTARPGFCRCYVSADPNVPRDREPGLSCPA
jgi:hypothetical protein